MDEELEQRIAEMSDPEFDALVARTRAPRIEPGDQLRAAETAGDWKTALRLKADMLGDLMNPTKD